MTTRGYTALRVRAGTTAPAGEHHPPPTGTVVQVLRSPAALRNSYRCAPRACKSYKTFDVRLQHSRYDTRARVVSARSERYIFVHSPGPAPIMRANPRRPETRPCHWTIAHAYPTTRSPSS